MNKKEFLAKEIKRWKAIEDAATRLFSEEWGILGKDRPYDDCPCWQALHDALVGESSLDKTVVIQTADVVTGTMIGAQIGRIG